MRPGKTLELVHVVTKAGAYGAETLPPHMQRHVTAPGTGWKSPVPYLFGGLAAMLGLIAFALLILACSYWKLSGNMDSGENSDDGGDELEKEKEMRAAVFANNSVLVIMAGEEKPTFLATPASSRTTSFGESDGKENCSCSCSCSSSSSDGGDGEERKEVESTETVVTSSTESRV